MPGVTASVWRLGATVAAPGLRRMLRRRARDGKEVTERLAEREGYEASARPQGKLLWLHAASVGEAMSVLPVLSRLAQLAPALSVLFTTGTVTSARMLERALPELGLARVQHRFVPLDVPAWAARFLDHWRPDAAAFVESELWPNLLAACQARGVGLMLINGRMSARSYRHWRRVAGFARGLIGAFDRVHAQSANYAERLALLGARGMIAPGNLKWAAPTLRADAAEVERLRLLLEGRPVWLAASTHPGEEALAGEVHRALLPEFAGLLTIVVPRHPGRGAEVAASLGAGRRSCQGPPDGAGIWVVDTMGELGLLYRLVTIVFVGGSLVPHGGQNALEAARFGCALATGPHTANFAEIVTRLHDAGGLALVENTGALTGFVGDMLRDPARRSAMGEAARRVADGEQALPDRVAGVLLELLGA